jgi:transposase
MTQVKKLDFSDSVIFCGIDVHRKSWRVNIHDGDFELEDFTQNASPGDLHRHLNRRYPGAKFKIAYEAGFSGFGVQRWFTSKGMECVVINPADLKSSDKERRQKNDKVDARRLCRELQTKEIKKVHIPSVHWEHMRSLVRARSRIVENQTRSKNRIWQLLHFSGLSLPGDYVAQQYWSARFIKELQDLDCGSAVLRMTLTAYVKDFLQTRSLLLEVTRNIRQVCKGEAYREMIRLLRTIHGIGQINAAVILSEIQNIERFPSLAKLYSYVGLVPDTSDSGDTKISTGITHRRNNFLRTALVESSWVVIRKDPAMLRMFKDYCCRMDKNKAIVRISKHLLARVAFVLRTKKDYESGVLGK